MWKVVIFIGIFVQAGVIVAQHRSFPHNPSLSNSGPPSNNGLVRSLEAQIVALEKIIKECNAKEVFVQEQERAQELRRIELDQRVQDHERRIRERESALDKREQEITAYQNAVLKDQDQREQLIERSGRLQSY